MTRQDAEINNGHSTYIFWGITTVAPPAVLAELFPFVIFPIEIVSTL